MKRLFLLFFIFQVVNGSAQTYLIENFVYGTLNDTFCGTGGVTANWTPHSNPGINPLNYTGTGITYAGYGPGMSIGNGAVTFSNGPTPRESANRQIPMVDTGSVYLSFILRVSGATNTNISSEYIVHFNDSSGNQVTSRETGRLFITNRLLIPNCSLAISKRSAIGSAVYSPTTYSISTSLLVVMRYKFNTGSTSDDSVYAWIFTSGVPGSEPPPLMIATDMTVPDLPRIQSVCIRQGTAGTSYGTIDGMRVGVNWASTVLPVTWLSFSAREKPLEGIHLNWVTATETESKNFEIERSKDGNHWEKSGEVLAAGNSNTTQNYSFIDRLPEDYLTQKVIYYRLKQNDKNGIFTYSKEIPINLDEEFHNESGIFPNPVCEYLNIPLQGEANLEIVDNIGNLVLQTNISGDARLPVKQFPAGLYFMRISRSTGIRTYRFLVEN